MASVGILNSLKNAKQGFKNLPDEAKTSYYTGFGSLVVIIVVLIFILSPSSDGGSEPSDSGVRSKARSKSANVSQGERIPQQLASEIVTSRRNSRDNEDVSFDRFSDKEEALNERRDDFIKSVKTDITQLNAKPEEPKPEPKPHEPTDTPIQTDLALEDDKQTEPEELFLGAVDSQSTNPDTTKGTVRGLLRDPELMQSWMSLISQQDTEALESKSVQMGTTVTFDLSKPKTDSESADNDKLPAPDQESVDESNYSGDVFLPGRKILARIDGYVESDTQTPFIRLRPVEGPDSWVNDAIFLAKPELVEGQGFVITTQTLTYGSNSGSFSAVAVTPDDSSNAILMDDFESRELQRLAYIVTGGALSGINTLAKRVGTTVSTGDENIVSSVELNKENIAISAFGGVGDRGEDYLFNKVANTKDNHILKTNKLVGLMILENPKHSWLPPLNKKYVY
ncbi:hypothetical protein [Alteromonas antoniana]|uniref:hypothetical protein n=1 Tax=Alteromonas antoniana TaxID=2803813 RepID=UPI001C480FAC|nr:hypothetical protein [Alteromonas antoniana]